MAVRFWPQVGVQVSACGPRDRRPATSPELARSEGIGGSAAAVLDSMGLTVSDAVRILLTRVATEGALPFPLSADFAAHDAWFRAKVNLPGFPGDSET